MKNFKSLNKKFFNLTTESSLRLVKKIILIKIRLQVLSRFCGELEINNNPRIMFYDLSRNNLL